MQGSTKSVIRQNHDGEESITCGPVFHPAPAPQAYRLRSFIHVIVEIFVDMLVTLPSPWIFEAKYSEDVTPGPVKQGRTKSVTRLNLDGEESITCGPVLHPALFPHLRLTGSEASSMLSSKSSAISFCHPVTLITPRTLRSDRLGRRHY